MSSMAPLAIIGNHRKDVRSAPKRPDPPATAKSACGGTLDEVNEQKCGLPRRRRVTSYSGRVFFSLPRARLTENVKMCTAGKVVNIYKKKVGKYLQNSSQ